MATTAKGYPYPAATDANDVPVDLQRLAEKNDARPGVSPLTTAARDALTGAELWDGRVIWNTSVLALQRYNAEGLSWHNIASTAAEIAYAGATTLAATNIEAALDELDAEKMATTDANAAYLANSAPVEAVTGASESTTSTAYADLATVGPAVTVDIGASGRALVILTSHISNNTAGSHALMGVATSGANATAAGDGVALFFQSGSAGQQVSVSKVHLVTGLAPGSTTFTGKYRVTGGTGTFQSRRLVVIPL